MALNSRIKLFSWSTNISEANMKFLFGGGMQAV